MAGAEEKVVPLLNRNIIDSKACHSRDMKEIDRKCFFTHHSQVPRRKSPPSVRKVELNVEIDRRSDPFLTYSRHRGKVGVAEEYEALRVEPN